MLLSLIMRHDECVIVDFIGRSKYLLKVSRVWLLWLHLLALATSYRVHCSHRRHIARKSGHSNELMYANYVQSCMIYTYLIYIRNRSSVKYASIVLKINKVMPQFCNSQLLRPLLEQVQSSSTHEPKVNYSSEQHCLQSSLYLLFIGNNVGCNRYVVVVARRMLLIQLRKSAPCFQFGCKFPAL